MANKKKKDDGLREFEIEYIPAYSVFPHFSNQRAIDKHDAILKFKQSNPGTKVKDAKEILKQQEPDIGRGLTHPYLWSDGEQISPPKKEDEEKTE